MKRVGLSLALASAALLSACIVVPAHHRRGYVAEPGIVVDAPPPAPYA